MSRPRTGRPNERPRTITPRLQQVLELRAQGLTAKEVSQELWITEHTANEYIKAINRVLAARNSVHAVAIGYQTGMLT